MAANSSTPASEHGLHRQLGLADLVLAQVLCVVGTMWVGVAAVLGRAQALMWIAAMQRRTDVTGKCTPASDDVNPAPSRRPFHHYGHPSLFQTAFLVSPQEQIQ